MPFQWKSPTLFFFAPRRLKPPLLHALRQHVFPKQPHLGPIPLSHKHVQRIQSGKPVERQQLPPPTRTELTHLKSLFSGGRSKQALELFHHTKHANALPITFYTSAIKACGTLGDCQQALNILREMQQKGPTPDVFIWSAVIGVCSKVGELNLASKLLEGMKAEGVEPNVVTYQSLISTCAKVGGQLSWALELLKEMQEKGISADFRTYSALISSCEKTGQLHKALELFQAMRKEGIKPDTITYSALISTCEKARHLPKALELFEEMQKEGIKPDTVTYSALISTCEKAHHLPKALELFEEMRKEGIKPNTVTYNALISTCEKTRHLPKALDLFEEMLKEGIKPDTITYNALICACKKISQLPKAMELLQEMKKSAVQPDIVTYRVLIDLFFHNGRLKEASALYHTAYQLQLFSHRHRSGQHHTIDLHGFTVACACCAVSKVLKELRFGSVRGPLIIIVGRGRHSRGAAKLPKFVPLFLRTLQPRFNPSRIPHAPLHVRFMHNNRGRLHMTKQALLEWLG
eukprot:NODE_906_length_1773_cov_42.927096_g850_i0.p1 GENE.NODE_906_length_1773_cov_42.927096_g850_i0~~NODE_906_length_1773_cov_42.927096_g850_i0.p1  ORF type:complete len:520 (+),score=106.24 NODE_906_length_1773_cov_42.927096_g850_i0:54-1613(+)